MKTGDRVPEFALPDQQGHLFDTTDLLGKKALVLFFYPKDHTYGCTRQVCAFRDHYQDFLEYGAEVVGISSDSEKSHQRFVKHYDLPFRLLADRGGKVRELFGVKGPIWGLLPGRETFVIDREGILRYRFNNMNPRDHMDRALDTIKSLSQV